MMDLIFYWTGLVVLAGVCASALLFALFVVGGLFFSAVRGAARNSAIHARRKSGVMKWRKSGVTQDVDWTYGITYDGVYIGVMGVANTRRPDTSVDGDKGGRR